MENKKMYALFKSENGRKTLIKSSFDQWELEVLRVKLLNNNKENYNDVYYWVQVAPH